MLSGGVARRGYVLAALTAIYAVNMMDRNILAILVEPIRQDMRISDTQLGLLAGLAFALFYTVFGVPVGWVADRFGRVKVIAVSCMFWSLCTFAGSFASSFPMLALSRAGVGIGEAGGTAPSYSLISSFFPPQRRGFALGIFHLGSSVAAVVTASIGAWIAQDYGWRMALAVVSLPGLVLAALLWLTVREPSHSAGKAPASPLWPTMRAFLTDRLLRTTALAAGFTAFSAYAIAAWLPAMLIRAKGMTLGDVAIWYGVTSALALGLGVGSAGWLADRLAVRSGRAYALVPMGATLAMAAIIPLAALLPNWPFALTAGLIALGLSNMFLAPLLTIVQNRSPEHCRSLYSATFLLINNFIGAGFGSLYVGMISDAFAARYGAQSLAIAFGALAPVAIIAAALHWRVSRILKS